MGQTAFLEKAGIPVIGHAQRDLPLEYSLRLKPIAHVEEFMYIFSKEQQVDDRFLQQAAKQVKESGAGKSTA